MIKNIFLSSALIISILSCSFSPEKHRAPSSDEAPLLLSDVFEIKASGAAEGSHLEPINKAYLQKLQQDLSQFHRVESDLSIEMQSASNLPSETKYALDFQMDLKTNQLKLIIKAAPDAKFDLVAQAELKGFLSALFAEASFNTVYDVFEAALNAKLGDLGAYKAFTLVRLRNLEELKEVDEISADFYHDRRQELQLYQTQLDQKLVEEQKIIKAQELERKASLAALDKMDELEQLKGLVAAGKRAETAELIRKYLPWEKMPPLERMFWEENLKYMADPLPLEERMIVFRGIDGDMTYPALEDGRFLAREVSEEKGNAFLMSSLLTKNQGTWNRRLRSLETMQEKVITQNAKTASNTYTKSSRISTMMYQHSLNPAGSPFLSYTPSISTARTFGKNRMAALLLDPRMTYANFSSAYKVEIEYLSTLVTFPDEMVGIYDSSRTDMTVSGLYFKNKLREKLSALYGEEKASVLSHQLMEQAKVMSSYRDVHNLQANSGLSTVEKKPGLFAKLINGLKRLFGKAEQPQAVASAAVEVVPEKVSKCANIIELFFKNAAKVH